MFNFDSQAYSGGQCVIDPAEGTGGIWISGIDFAKNLSALKKSGIGAVLSAVDLELGHPKDIEIMKLRLDDSEDQKITQHFGSAFEFIEKHRARTNVLVHCAAGISRSSAMLISYLMRKYQLTFEKAWDLVKSKRSCSYPNMNFQTQLRNFEKSLKL
jgi:hypothetical protein